MCPEYDITTYQPGVTMTPRPVQISSSGDLAPCTAPGDPTLTSGSYKGSGTGTVSCTTGTFDGLVTYHWNNGHESKLSYTAVIGSRVGGEVVVVYRGTVTDGEFAGDSYTSSVTVFNTVPEKCLTEEGVTSTGGPSVSAFTAGAATPTSTTTAPPGTSTPTTASPGAVNPTTPGALPARVSAGAGEASPSRLLPKTGAERRPLGWSLSLILLGGSLSIVARTATGRRRPPS
jgi:hypothetical protein